MEPKIINKDSFFVIGYELRTDSARSTEEIPRFWSKVDLGRLDSVPNRTEPKVQLGLCCSDDEKGCFSYLVCTPVRDLSSIPTGMAGRTVPAARYAVFTAKGPVPKAIQDTWLYIYFILAAEIGVRTERRPRTSNSMTSVVRTMKAPKWIFTYRSNDQEKARWNGGPSLWLCSEKWLIPAYHFTRPTAP